MTRVLTRQLKKLSSLPPHSSSLYSEHIPILFFLRRHFVSPPPPPPPPPTHFSPPPPPPPPRDIEEVEDNTSHSSQNKNSHLNPEPIFPKEKSEVENAPENLIDWASIKFRGGSGGLGAIRFTSIFMKQYAGPDGGDGGNGGHVVITAKAGLGNFQHLGTEIEIKADDGEKGDRFNMHGRAGEHLFVEVPLGTMVKDPDSQEMFCELITDGQIYVAARGGTGGKGNTSFLTNENRAPEYAEEGAPGEERPLHLEMRTIADLGLIGFPNAGKSTLLRSISRARPKVASYPFTTTRPHVGSVHFTDETKITVADIPGIIPNAHKGYGLGIDFLRHVQRCKCLLYVIDLSVDDVIDQLLTLRFELEQFEKGLSSRPRAILGNKIDLKDAKINFLKLKRFLDEEGKDVHPFPVSGKNLINVKDLLLAMKSLVDASSTTTKETTPRHSTTNDYIDRLQ